MKIILLTLILIAPAMAYDGVIKNNYGQIVGYVDVDVDDQEVRLKNRYGRTQATVELDDSNLQIKDGYDDLYTLEFD